MFLLDHRNRSVGIFVALMLMTSSTALVLQTTQTSVSTIHAALPTTITTLVDTLVPRTKLITIDPITLPDKTIGIKIITLDIPECTQTITPDSNGYVPPGSCNAQYNYYPSFAAALVAAIFFGVVTFAHIAEGIKYKKVSLSIDCWNLN